MPGSRCFFTFSRATGTTSWTVTNIPLVSGENSVNITATNGAGLTRGTSLTVYYTPPDTTAPTIGISSPATDPFAAVTAGIALSGTAVDAVGVTQVNWLNAATGGSGVAVVAPTGGSNYSWTATGVALQAGANPITVTARDAAGNSGTDTVMVNYALPAAGFSVSAYPAALSVVPGQNNVLTVTYTASGGGTRTVTSVQGRFATPGGELLETVDRGITLGIVNNSGSATETVTIPARVITAALKQNAGRVLYQRTFDGSAAIEVSLQIVPAAAGPLAVSRLELNFVHKGTDPGRPQIVSGEKLPRATVSRNSTTLKVLADLTYTGSGTLQARWLVDGQILGYVTQALYAGIPMVTIESPEVPSLPTYATGQHSVKLQIVGPLPSR